MAPAYGNVSQAQIGFLLWAERALTEHLEQYESYQEYYIGDHPLMFATDKWKDAFGDTFEEFADNWCQVVVDAPTQRMKIEGWDSLDKGLAREANDLWEKMFLGLEAKELHTQAFVKGDAFIMVWEDPDNLGTPELYYNDATEVQVHYDSRKKRRVERATKVWTDEDATRHLAVYFPNHTQLYIVPSTVTEAQVAMGTIVPNPSVLPVGWQVDGPPIPNPYDVVPVFHFKNRGSGLQLGVSELKSVVPMQNAVNKLLMDLMVGSELGSYRQKWMAGGGHPKEGWKTGANRLWATTDPAAKFGEFGQIDLEPVMKAVEGVVGHIAKITQTPMHYLRSSGDMPSGEALKTAESGMVHKVQDRQETWSLPWSQAMELFMKIQGDTVDDLKLLKPIWKSAETRHDLEQAQTAQLKAILGIPLEQLWSEHFNYDENQIEEFKKDNLATFTAVLQQVLAQSGQLPPGVGEGVAGATAGPPGTPPIVPQGQIDPNTLMAMLPQLLALQPKGLTSQTPAGEATTKPQPNSRPPGSPTRRSTGFKD
jgi:hypothetical protein